MPVSAIEFDFANRIDRQIGIEQVPDALQQGHSCWIDLNLSDGADAKEALHALALNSSVMESLGTEPSVGRHDVYDDCLHISISIPTYARHEVHFETVELILADRMIVTLHRGEHDFVDRVRESYPNFFRKFALSIGFLLFEIWDLLIESYRRVLAEIEEDVEQTQRSVFSGVGEEIFQRVSQLTTSVLEVRRNALAMHDCLEQLATHTSAFVPSTSQPYLLNMVGSLERVSGDLTVQRETLAEALTLYLGMVSHRTNQLVHRLTLVSIVFLPLTFLCGVYGMNFELPEYSWPFGFVYFWAMAVACVVTMVTWMRVRRMW